jgi:GH15 family glucan-1,4-alpha-glucosidase
MTDRDLDEIMILWWPQVLRRAMRGTDDWLKSFTRSIARHAKRPDWRPSDKQAWLMRKLVDDLRAPPEPEFDLIEQEGGRTA